MSKKSEQKPHVEGRNGNRVSSAVWPLNVRKVVATGKAAQRRRDWIMQGRWLLLLADALAMRLLFLLAMVLMVVTSLLVAILGLNFWYLLLLPLLLLAGLFLRPWLLARWRPAEMAPPTLATFAQEFKSSAGVLSLYAQELKSQPGFFSLKSQSGLLSLKSQPGFFSLKSQSGLLSFKSQPGLLPLKSEPGLLSGETPSTPMPDDHPLVRVLETYDLRSAPVEHFLHILPGEETGEHALVHAAGTELLERNLLDHGGLENQLWGNRDLSIQDFPKSEPGQQGDL